MDISWLKPILWVILFWQDSSTSPSFLFFISSILWSIKLLVRFFITLTLVTVVQNCIFYRSKMQKIIPYQLDRRGQDVMMKNDIFSLIKSTFCFLTCWIRTLPDVYILGPVNCGESSLQSALLSHPAFRSSPSSPKQIHYFQGRSFLRTSSELLGLDWLLYRMFWPLLPWKWIMAWWTGERQLSIDATPTLHFPQLAARIAAATPHARAITLLRDPIERAYSNYDLIRRLAPHLESRSWDEAALQELNREESMYYRNLDTKGFIDESLSGVIHGSPIQCVHYLDMRYLHSGLYAEHLYHFTKSKAFGGRLLVLSYTDWCNDPLGMLNRICSFLEIREFTAAVMKGVELPVKQTNGNGDGNGSAARGVLSAGTLSRLEWFYAESNAIVMEKYGVAV